jgi:iron-regulated transporter 1
LITQIILTSGSMIAFLSQYSNFSTPLIAGLRAIAVIIGILATFLSPPLIRYIGPIRSGIWFLSWQTILLIPVIIGMFLPLSRTLQGGLLVGFVSLSRLGLWGFDLSEQYLVQEEIDSSMRGEFSTTEAALQNMFDLLQFMSTIIFSRPEMFKWPVLMSCISVGIGLCVYALFVRKRRGHLIHIYEKILDREGCLRQSQS